MSDTTATPQFCDHCWRKLEGVIVWANKGERKLCPKCAEIERGLP